MCQFCEEARPEKKRSREQRGTGDTKNCSVVHLEKQIHTHINRGVKEFLSLELRQNLGQDYNEKESGRLAQIWVASKKREHIHSFIINVSGLKTNSKAKMYSRSSMLHSLGLLSVVALYFERNPEFLFPVVNGFAVESFEFLFFFFYFFLFD